MIDWKDQNNSMWLTADRRTNMEEKRMQLMAINFIEKFSLFDDYWSPKCIAQLDNYLVKVVKIKGHFTWHTHADCDEIFIVHKGKMRIDFRNESVELNKDEMFVVQKGKEHKPFSEDGCEIILLERVDVVNTGDKTNEFTKEKIEWI